jgi:hypothetical protein
MMNINHQFLCPPDDPDDPDPEDPLVELSYICTSDWIWASGIELLATRTFWSFILRTQYTANKLTIKNTTDIRIISSSIFNNSEGG